MTMVLIEVVKFWTAGFRWRDMTSDDESSFTRFLGMRPQAFADNLQTYIEVPEETANRIELLLSPHYRTIIKAWYARQSSTETA